MFKWFTGMFKKNPPRRCCLGKCSWDGGGLTISAGPRHVVTIPDSLLPALGIESRAEVPRGQWCDLAFAIIDPESLALKDTPRLARVRVVSELSMGGKLWLESMPGSAAQVRWDFRNDGLVTSAELAEGTGREFLLVDPHWVPIAVCSTAAGRHVEELNRRSREAALAG